MVKDDAIPFNREGKNVFCAFVVDCDPEVRPMDEVMVVDAQDHLVALGRALLTREEMFAFRTGSRGQGPRRNEALITWTPGPSPRPPRQAGQEVLHGVQHLGTGVRSGTVW